MFAQRAGAVNTFWIRNGVLHGENTDVSGFDHAARVLLGRPPSAEQVLLLGAGGAAAAVAAAVEQWPDASVIILSRNAGRASLLAERFAALARLAAGTSKDFNDTTLLVNATPVGLYDDAIPIEVDLLPPGCSVLDLVYTASETALVHRARNRGLAAADGREMLLEQGALSFRKWFDVEPDRMVMREALARLASDA
jgi:shikimate dehydrogenase